MQPYIDIIKRLPNCYIKGERLKFTAGLYFKRRPNFLACKGIALKEILGERKFKKRIKKVLRKLIQGFKPTVCNRIVTKKNRTKNARAIKKLIT